VLIEGDDILGEGGRVTCKFSIVMIVATMIVWMIIVWMVIGMVIVPMVIGMVIVAIAVVVDFFDLGVRERRLYRGR